MLRKTVAVLSSGGSSRAFMLLPYVLRTGSILMFNDHLDYFPLKLGRLSSLAQHVSGHGSVGALLRWAVGRTTQEKDPAPGGWGGADTQYGTFTELR